MPGQFQSPQSLLQFLKNLKANNQYTEEQMAILNERIAGCEACVAKMQ